MNVKVNLLFYLLSFLFAFISRKVFIDCLSEDFVGLTGTLTEIVAFLLLAEMGVGTSIGYFLYKPLQAGDHQKTCEILSVMGYIYKYIGIFIGSAGLLISLSFPFVFTETSLPLPFIYFTFYSYIGSTLIRYFINYRQIIFAADQRNYVISAYTQTMGFAKTGLQIFLAYYYKNLYIWVAIEFLFSWIYCLVLNYRIKKVYPWLKVNKANGKILLKEYSEIWTKSKQVFVQSIKNFLLRGSDQIFIFAFCSLQMVVYYTNYMMIFNKVNLFVNVVSDGMNAGVGNLVAEGNIRNTMKVFWELNAIRFLITGVLVFGLLFFTEPFIGYWLGEKYIMNHWILYIIVLNMFIMLSRGTVEMYISSYGLFSDVWAAWTELGVNLAITIVGGYFYGIWGIVLAKLISVLPIALFWKPYFLFKNGLKQPLSTYWQGMLKYYGLLAVSLLLAWPVVQYLLHAFVDDMFTLVVVVAITTAVYTAFYFLALYACTNGMKYFVARVPVAHNLLRKLHL